MRTVGFLLMLSLAITGAGPSGAQEPGAAENGSSEAAQEASQPDAGAEASKGLGHRLLFYVPNRILDVLDPVRARVRLGQGGAVSARATKPLSVFFGSYTSAFVGLPGPRGTAKFPWPWGPDSKAGARVSVAGETTESHRAPGGPGYTSSEIGVGAQAVAVGIDVGIDPFELLDLVTGLVLVDLRGDDF